MAELLFGTSIKRREDPRFITGKGTYVDDVRVPGTTDAAFVRSPHAHARIARISLEPAKSLKSVVAAYTGKDLVSGGMKPIPTGWLIPNMKIPAHYPLAVDRARYMGDAVAVVIAESPYVARDAADLVEVDYEPLPAVTDPAQALERGAPGGPDEAPGKGRFRWRLGGKGATGKGVAGPPAVA